MKTIIIIAIGVAAYALIVALVRGFAASRRSGAQDESKASDSGDGYIWWGDVSGHDGGGHDGANCDGGGGDGGGH
jgi:hypothetical protein